MPEPSAPATNCGFIAVIGAPNAGKSTLVNALVGAKVSIVSRKAQTTRASVRGIAMHGRTQLIFIDTAGIFQPKRRLDRAMVTAAWGGAADADLVAFVLDARRGLEAESESILRELAANRLPAVLVLNKIDLVERPQLLALTRAANELAPFRATYMVSAETGDGLADLRASLAGFMPEGPWLFPEDDVSDVPMRSLAAEITREKIYDRLHQELPYHATVETEEWREEAGGAVRISQAIFVERDGQKKIVIGKNGQTIKAIGQAARKELEEMLERRVHLFLFVKVRGNWADDPERYRAIGLDFPKA